MRKSAKDGATKWDARANGADTYAGVTVKCGCGCERDIHRNFDAFILDFIDDIAPERRDAFRQAVIDGQERHCVAGDDATGAWTGCAEGNRRTQQADDFPTVEGTEVTPVTGGTPEGVRADAERRRKDEDRRRKG